MSLPADQVNQITKTHLFTAREGGYWTYRIPGLAVTPGGVVLATTEARRGKGGDWDGNDVLMRRSLDGGVTWEPPKLVVRHEDYGPGPISNFVMIPDRVTGVVHALFCHNYSRAFYMSSSDDGKHFSSPRDITAAFETFRAGYDWNVIATGPGHGLQLSNGRLIVPIWMSNGGRRHRPSEASVIYSDDHGASWHAGDVIVRTDDEFRFPSEATVVELSDGRVLINVRTESDRQRRVVSTSPDGATGWTKPRFDEQLLDPVCMASLIRATPPDAGNHILFTNPDNLERTLPGLGEVNRDRKRLTVKVSTDDCSSWTASRVIEEGPSGYSDLAIAPDGAILCLYECGIIERMADDKHLTLARFDLDWVLNPS